MKNPWMIVTRFAALGLGILVILFCLGMEVGFTQLGSYLQLSASVLVIGGAFSLAAFAHSPATVLKAVMDVFGLRPRVTAEDLERSARAFQTLSEIAVPFGWSGVLLGTIVILQNLEDPKQIGHAMGLALISALYGFFLRAVFFIPCRDMLRELAKETKA